MEQLCAIFERLSLSEKRKRTLEYNDEETSTKKLLHPTHVKTNVVGPPSIAQRVRMETARNHHQRCVATIPEPICEQFPAINANRFNTLPNGRTGINPHTRQPGNLLKNNLVVNSSDRGRIVYFGSKPSVK